MKENLQNNLLKKYPEFFSYLDEGRKIYTGNNGIKELLNQKAIVLPIQFGFECGDGWYLLLNELMSNIQEHMKWKNEYADRKLKWEIAEKIVFWIRNKISNKFGRYLEKILPKGRPHIILQIDQIKEKFGGLRFYYSGGDDEISGMVRLAESLSYHICEFCGTTHNVGMTKGWFSTICKSCLELNPRLNNLKWEPNEENNIYS
jgi:hypothetical protein